MATKNYYISKQFDINGIEYVAGIKMSIEHEPTQLLIEAQDMIDTKGNIIGKKATIITEII
ncbi:unnamed protein product [marine sediment metagenome]|uniref:Uncharacterized protein n=1 Tax=marine sediment metagenome TaxID=412755 RepID=X1BFA0_9ZZZZ